MPQTAALLILSDPHGASPAELARADPEGSVIPRPWLRPVARAFRRLWLGDLVRNNQLLDQFVQRAPEADLVVANGDYSCDSAFVGLSDDVSLASAQACLAKLRGRFGSRFEATMGDHELGRQSLFGGRGGLRLASWSRCLEQLQLRPFWQASLGACVLMGITSSLVGLDAFASQVPPEEAAAWRQLREEHLRQIRGAFENLDPKSRVVLFLHDPAALAWLARDNVVRSRLHQIDRTIAGHYHFRWVIQCLQTLGRWRSPWFREFKLLVCPALACRTRPLAGLYFRAELDLTGHQPAQFSLLRLR